MTHLLTAVGSVGATDNAVTPTGLRQRTARRGFVFALATSLTLALSSGTHAQEVIPLEPTELSRLAIVFAPVQMVASHDGDRVPATVVSQPDVPATLNALFQGQLQRWHVETGARVEAGQVIATLRSEDLLGAQLAWLEASVMLGGADSTLARDQQLFDAGVVSNQRLQTARRNHQQAAASEAATRRLLLSAGISSSELSSLADNPAALGEYTLRAPDDGIVMQRLVSAGSAVSDGDALVAFRGNAPLWISARIPARLAQSLEPDAPLTLEGYSTGLTLRLIDQQIDRLSQTIGIQAEFNDEAQVMPGQLVTLILPPADQGVRVPSEAVVHAGDETTVYVRTDNGAEARTLRLLPSGRHYIARDGLRAGEQVAVQGASVLKGIQLGLGGAE